MTNFLIIATDAILTCICIFLTIRVKNVEDRMDAQTGANKALVNTFKDSFEKFQKRIEELENGVVPDYEAAKEAAKAVNDFNAGISGILGFDPVAAYRKNQIKE